MTEIYTDGAASMIAYVKQVVEGFGWHGQKDPKTEKC